LLPSRKLNSMSIVSPACPTTYSSSDAPVVSNTYFTKICRDYLILSCKHFGPCCQGDADDEDVALASLIISGPR
jgi:hypothetical protein